MVLVTLEITSIKERWIWEVRVLVKIALFKRRSRRLKKVIDE